MAISITLNDELAAEIIRQAKLSHLTAEQLALSILEAALEKPEADTPEEVVARIRATAPNPSSVRPATADLAELLRTSPDDPNFHLQEWQRQWAAVEREMKAMTRANDQAEGRGG